MNAIDAFDADIEDRIAKAVWCVLHIAAKGSHTCSLSLRSIAVHLGISRCTARRAIVELERLKLVEITRRDGRGNTPEFRIKGLKMASKGSHGFSNEINEKTKTSLFIDDTQPDRETLSKIQDDVRSLNRRLKVVHRRKRVRDGYLTFLSMLGPDQYITASALANELGLSASTVRNDLMALFRSLDIPLDAQLRLRKSQRRPWHQGRMDGRVIPFYDRNTR